MISNWLVKPRTGWYLAFGIVGAYVTTTSQLIILSGMVILIGSLGLLAFLVKKQLVETSCDRRVPAGVYEYAELESICFVEYDGWFPLVLPKVTDNIPFSADLKTFARWPGALRRGQRLRLSISVTSRSQYGRYQLGPLSLRVGDPAGLFEFYQGFERYDPITLYPRWAPIRWLPVLGGRQSFAEQPRSTQKTASGQDLYGIREYRPGDPIRHIHWRSVAKHDELIVKQFEFPSSRKLHLFVDLHRARRSGIGGQSTLNATIKLASSVAAYGIRSGHSVGLHGEGNQPVYLPPRSGDHQLRTILETLIDLEQEGDLWLDELLSRRLDLLGEQATVAMVVPVTRLDPDAYLESISVLEARQATVVMMLIDDAGMVRYDGSPEEYERDWSPAELRRTFLGHGAWCEVIDPGEPLEQQIGQKEQWEQPRVSA